jgi:hypothetical protein
MARSAPVRLRNLSTAARGNQIGQDDEACGRRRETGGRQRETMSARDASKRAPPTYRFDENKLLLEANAGATWLVFVCAQKLDACFFESALHRIDIGRAASPWA